MSLVRGARWPPVFGCFSEINTIMSPMHTVSVRIICFSIPLPRIFLDALDLLILTLEFGEVAFFADFFFSSCLVLILKCVFANFEVQCCDTTKLIFRNNDGTVVVMSQIFFQFFNFASGQILGLKCSSTKIEESGQNYDHDSWTNFSEFHTKLGKQMAKIVPNCMNHDAQVEISNK